MPDISGTFRSSHEADSTVSRLKEAGFRLDQIGIEEAPSDLNLATGRQATPSGTRIQPVTVTVHAGSRTGDARAILQQCGAYDVNLGDDVQRAIHEPVASHLAPTPFGARGDVENGLT